MNGIITKNDAQSFKKAIVLLMKDKKKMKFMGANAQKTIRDDFSVKTMVNSYESFYNNLLQKVKSEKPHGEKVGNEKESRQVNQEN